MNIPLTADKIISFHYPKGNMTAGDFEALKLFIQFLELSEGVKKKEE